MFSRYRHWPLAQQIIAATVCLLLLLFSLSTLVATRAAESAAIVEAERSLQQGAQLIADMLELAFRNAQERGGRQSDMLAQLHTGPVRLGEGLHKTGAVDLPPLYIGGTLINANQRILEEFKGLSGSEAAYLIVHEGKVWRATTLLKKDGQFMNGVPLPDKDPVTQAVLKGENYTGLTIRNGEYNFSVVRVLKNAEGKVVAAASVRTPLADELKGIRATIAKQVSGKTGYGFLMRPTGDKDSIAEFVSHPKFEGKLVGEVMKDEALRDIPRQMLAIKSGTLRYDFPSANGSMQPKLAGVAVSPSWGWVVSIGSWLDEYLEEGKRLRTILIVVSLVSALLSGIMVLLLVRSRMAPLVGMVDELSKLGSGDLRARVPEADPHSRSEIYQLGHSLNTTADGVRQLIANIAVTAERVKDSAGQLEAASRQVRDSSESQSREASTMAASIEELSAAVTLVADSAGIATEASQEAKEATRQGREVVENTVQEMERIATEIRQSADFIQTLGERSQQISSVVGVIREIAEQTNLLALNAAIEAARAGEAGRGFAVVADEVRKLAERTALSTSEIAGTVESIVGDTQAAVARMQGVSERMGTGVDLARQAGESLNIIDGRTDHAVAVVSDIASSTKEQSVASQHIASSVEQIAAASGDNAAAAEANNEAARRLRELADELQGALRRFQV